METTNFSRKSKELPLLGSSISRTELSDILEISIELVDIFPEILEMIAVDLTAHGIEKKKKRLKDRAWLIRHGELPGFETDDYKEPKELELEIGRNRTMTPVITYIFIMLRGHFSSLTASKAIDRIRDSKVVDVYIKTYGDGSMPGRTTALENVNAVSLDTKEYIHQCQLKMAHDEGLDDFSELILDSTAVEADSCWPTDSGILCDIAHRGYRKSQRLNELFGIPDFMDGYMNMWLGKIRSYHFQISVTSGNGAKVKRRSVYRKLYREVEKVVRHIRKEFKKHGSIKEAVLLPPSKRERLDKFWNSIAADMNDAELVMAYSKERIIDEKGTNVEKIVSISGSKGKDLISEEEWESELYKEARRNRSAVESLIFVLKYSFEFGRLRRGALMRYVKSFLRKRSYTTSAAWLS